MTVRAKKKKRKRQNKAKTKTKAKQINITGLLACLINCHENVCYLNLLHFKMLCQIHASPNGARFGAP